ncbi:MraY family glycosyltransferase [Sanyastnella coralliicola]|uniref:MraY family glycosyltransferase n=1 Tax=Sanyastnella coralliicola TaxID=3069118 RepID=UPI0027B8E074|nr:MraY family glycosyltransferase [Longitalea sp. SCSIO 12813]
MTLATGLFILCAFALSIAVNGLLLRFLRTLGTKNQEAKLQVRWSAQTKPTIGGISFFTGFLFSFLFAALVIDDPVMPMSAQVAILIASTLGFVMGLADDAFNTKPLLKFLAQIACGLILAFGGITIDLGVGRALDMFFTVLWVITLMNSLNMLDNMDGVSSSVALTILGAIWFALPTGSVVSLICLGMMLTIGAFLVFNWHPSSMYMGDSGSQLIGVLVAAMTLVYAQGELSFIPAGGASLFVGLILLCFTTLCDTAVVTSSRLMSKRSPFVGGRDHTTHNLSYLGLKDNLIAFIYFVWNILNASLAIFLLTYTKEGITRWLLGVVLYMLLVFISFFIVSRKNLHKGKYTY